MKYLAILAITLAAACGKEETPTTKTPELTVPTTPGIEAPKPPAEATDAAKASLDKAIADTKDLIAKKEAAAKALLEKIKADPMKAAAYQSEYDQLMKDIAELQKKLDGYVKEAAGK